MLRRTLIIVVAILAVTGGSATAAKLITGKDIKNSSVTGADIKNKSLGAGELSAAARKALTGQTGPAGPAGAKGANGANGTNGTNGTNGAKGDKGDTGPRGPSDAFAINIPSVHTIDGASDSREIVGGQLPEGNYLLTAKIVVRNHHGVDNNRPNCELGIKVGDDDLFMALDQTDVIVGTDDADEETVVTLLAGAEVPDNGTPYLVRCEPTGDTYDMRFRDRALTAIQVATLTTP
jgi:hypothetical protein